MPHDSDLAPPEATTVDHAHALVKGAIGSAPVVGNMAAEIFQLVLGPPLQKRQQKWMESIADAINDLRETAGCKPEDLSANPTFVDTLCRATQIAVRTSQSEKLDALRNAVLNAALAHAPEEAVQQIFLGWVDTLTVWHLRVLSVLADPREWFKRSGRRAPEYQMMSSLQQLISDAYPELATRQPFLGKLAEDLFQQGIINTHGLQAMMSASGAYAKRATELGEQFLAFITKPTCLG